MEGSGSKITRPFPFLRLIRQRLLLFQRKKEKSLFSALLFLA